MPIDPQLSQYLSTLTPEERAEYLRNHKEINAPEQGEEPDAPARPPQARRSPFNMQAYGVPHNVDNGFMRHLGPAAQAGYLQSMVDGVNDAHKDEMDSRVVQAREEDRQQHQKEMAAMDNDILIQRLQMEQREREKDRILQKQLTSGVINRQFIDGRWVDV